MRPTLPPNKQEAVLAELAASGDLPKGRVWLMLAIRSAASFAMLLALAAAFSLAGREDAVNSSAAWWLWFVTVTNVLSIFLMAYFGRKEGLRLRDIYFVNRSTWKLDLVWLAVGFAVTALIAQPPGTMLATWLWGDGSFPNSMLFQPLPLWAVYPLFVLMPTTHAFAELPVYWGYVAPRFRALGMRPWVSILVVGAALSVQHMFFSFQLDWRYDVWLAIKFFPFALWTGFLVYRRPTVLPYLMGGHLLLDSLLPVLVLMVSRGVTL